MYSIKDIQKLIKRSPQSIYRLMKSNKELSALMPEHTINKGHNVFYDDTIYEWFRNHYMIEESPSAADPLTETGVGGEISGTEAGENPQTNPPPSPDYAEAMAAKDELIAELRRQVSSLEAEKAEEKARHEQEIADIEQDLRNKEAERLHFVSENDTLVKLLAAEKQEKQRLLLMLPPPEKQKRTLGQRIRAFFKRNEADKEAAEDE